MITPELEEHAFWYLSDIVVLSKSFKQYVKFVIEILRSLREAKLKPNMKKCHLG
jgi:hypothetical protein